MADFPKLTDTQCQVVLDWISERLKPWDQVWSSLDQIIEMHGFKTGPQEMRDYAEQMPLRVIGGHGGCSWKPSPSYVDVDVAFMVDKEFNRGDMAFLVWVAKARATQEIYEQQQRMTIEGLELDMDGKTRRLDFPKLAWMHNGVGWIVPSSCHHCCKRFNDGLFQVVDGVIVHESCVAAGAAPPFNISWPYPYPR